MTIIAEGIPENKTKRLIKKANALGVTIIGPATVNRHSSSVYTYVIVCALLLCMYYGIWMYIHCMYIHVCAMYKHLLCVLLYIGGWDKARLLQDW